MSKPKLYYFDAPVSRGEECRLALHLANVDFEDIRIKREEWPAFKARAPYGQVPVLELEGRPALSESNAILVFIGRKHDLHPSDPFEAARHEMLLSQVESLRAAVTPTMRMTDDAEKKRAREALASDYLPAWGRDTERQLGDGPFFAGSKIHVVDIKLHMGVRWFASGALDHIPATIFSSYPKLMRLHDAVRDDARIKAWYAKTAK
jgi:glutathione S-transferase